jgi:TetR/AcrR family transcriptional regulator
MRAIARSPGRARPSIGEPREPRSPRATERHRLTPPGSWQIVPPVRKERSKASGTPSVSDDTRERILAGAARAFGNLGYAAARVEDVLTEAEISRPTFYKAFDGKDDVFEELSVRHHREIRERVMRSLEGVTEPARQVENVVDTFMRWRAELGPIGRVLDQEARTPGTRLARHRRDTLDAMSTWGAERLRAAGRGDVDPVLYHGLIAAMESIADALLVKPKAREASIERATRIALRIVAGALAAPGDPVPEIPAPPRG